MNTLQNILSKIPPPLKNKYLLVLISAIVWLLFFDSNNIFNQYELYKEKKSLLNQKKYYQEEIEKIKEEKNTLFGNNENLEKFAREKYLMKKDSETLFVVEFDTIKKSK